MMVPTFSLGNTSTLTSVCSDNDHDGDVDMEAKEDDDMIYHEESA